MNIFHLVALLLTSSRTHRSSCIW